MTYGMSIVEKTNIVNIFEKDDIVECIDNSDVELDLTMGKRYTILRGNVSRLGPRIFVLMKSDRGEEIDFFSSRFKKAIEVELDESLFRF